MVIIKAAIMFQNGDVIEGHSYGEISSLAHKLSYTGDRIHGFVTSSDTFVLPDEAAEIALNSNQINEKVDRLTPSMIWTYVREDE